MPLQTNQGNKKTSRMALSAILTALALVFSYVDALIPIPVGVPGMKLGLANLVVITALYTLNGRYALTINIVRILLSSAMFGSLSMALYSLAGALLSFVIMVILKKTGLFSIIGVSMAGGVFHNVGQLLVAAAVVEDIRLMLYLPVLLIVGMITGIVNGMIASKIVPYFK